jgi:hypothetical protein
MKIWIYGPNQILDLYTFVYLNMLSFWVEVNLCRVFLSFVYICIAVKDPVIKKGGITKPHFCACPKQSSRCLIYCDFPCAVLEMKIWIYGPNQILDLYTFVYLNKNWKIYWSEQSFTGHREDCLGQAQKCGLVIPPFLITGSLTAIHI